MERRRQEMAANGSMEARPVGRSRPQTALSSQSRGGFAQGGMGDDLGSVYSPRSTNNTSASSGPPKKASGSFREPPVVRVKLGAALMSDDLDDGVDEMDVMSSPEAKPKPKNASKAIPAEKFYGKAAPSNPSIKSAARGAAKPARKARTPVPEPSPAPAAKKPRPKPRPLKKATSDNGPLPVILDDDDEPDHVSPVTSPPSTGSSNSRSKRPDAPRPFPMALPASKSASKDGSDSDAMDDEPVLLVASGSASKDTAPAKSVSSFPMQLPHHAQSVEPSRPGPFSSATVPSSDAPSVPKLAPFPMALRPPTSSQEKAVPIDPKSRGKKRESPKSKAGSEDATRARKRNRRGSDGQLPTSRGAQADVDKLGSFGSIRLGSSSPPSVAPEHAGKSKEICPFCDEPWPNRPSGRLVRLLEQVKARAWKEPRLANPNGLTAPMQVFISVCIMHRSETRTIPDGIAEGWPSVIDFRALPGRLHAMRKRLRTMVEDPSEGPFFKAAKKDILDKGARIATSAIGQYETFERCQPGYYGEQGMVVIHRTLKEMFPDILQSCEPLEPDDFIRQVLVPEAAILLIKEDMKIDRAAALPILLKSRQYGLAQFPDRDVDASQRPSGESPSPIAERRSAIPKKTVPAVKSSLSSVSSLKSPSTAKRAKSADSRKENQPNWKYTVREDESEEEPMPVKQPKQPNSNSWLLSDDSPMDAAVDAGETGFSYQSFNESIEL